MMKKGDDEMIPITQEENTKNLMKEIQRIDLNGILRVILLDGDRTLCEQDTSRFLNKYCQIPLEPIKKSFQKYGYTYPGFYNICSCYSQIERAALYSAAMGVKENAKLVTQKANAPPMVSLYSCWVIS